jgi:hypothetical protein
MKASQALICLAVVVVGCGANPQAPHQAAADKLYEAVPGPRQPMLAVIDSESHARDRELTLGTPSADWKHVYTIVATSLLDTNSVTGDLVNTLQLHGIYHLPAASANGIPGGSSPDGRWLVVENFDGPTTHMLVIDTGTLTIRQQVALDGQFEFDAVDNQAADLYLIQRLNGHDYYVRLYDLTAGSLTPNIVADKSDGGQAMTGLRLAGMPSADGQWLFSIYVRAHQSPFIHALSLGGPFALCLDLPGDGYLDDPAEMQWSLAMSRDRSRMYAVNTATGVVALMTSDANGPSIVRTARFTGTGTTQPRMRGAVVTGSTLVAGGPSGLTWIDTSSLQVVARSIPEWSIAGVGLSPDGRHLYAVSEEGRVAVIGIDSRGVEAMFDPLAGSPMALMRVAAA